MAGTSIGLFSTDTLFLSTSPASGFNKTTWKQESADKIGAAIVTDIKYRASDGYVAVATHGSGAFATWYFGDTPPVIPVADVNVTAYPNPANDKIYFSFDATGTSSFHAEVYDISGRRVEAFSNGINNNTIFTQTVDVSHYRDGHYFITFYMDDHRKQVKQFIVHHHN